MHRAMGVLAAAVGLTAAGSVPAAANPPVVASYTFACDQAEHGADLLGPIPATGLDRALVRLTVTNGSASREQYGYRQVPAGAQAWWLGELSANRIPSGPYCWPAGTAGRLDVFAVPSAPAEFSGVSAQGEDTYVEALAARRGPYAAEVTVTQGAVRLAGGPTIASTGSKTFLDVDGGRFGVTFAALDGPPAEWQVQLRPLPLQVTNVTFSPAAAPAGAPMTLGYTLNADASVTASIVSDAGTVVRTLAAGLSARMGQRSLTWDGRARDGSALADGRYVATVDATDAYGMHSSGLAPVMLDSTGPSAIRTSPPTITPQQALTIEVEDTLAGVQSYEVEVDKAQVAREGDDGSSAPDTRTAYRPRGGWGTGPHAVVVTARDTVGNEHVTELSFSVQLPVLVAACGTVGARPSRLLCLRAGRQRVTLDRIRWSTWGGARATGTGTLRGRVCSSEARRCRGIGQTGRGLPVAISLSRRVRCGATLRYSRLSLRRLRGNRATTTVPLAACRATS